MEIKIEFPSLTLYGYNGVDNLDVTWDDIIGYLIHKPLYENGIGVNHAQLDIIEAEPQVNDERISYTLRLNNLPQEFTTDWIVKSLKEQGYERGLCIKEVAANGQEHILYFEPDCADIQLRRQTREYRKSRKSDKSI